MWSTCVFTQSFLSSWAYKITPVDVVRSGGKSTGKIHFDGHHIALVDRKTNRQYYGVAYKSRVWCPEM